MAILLLVPLASALPAQAEGVGQAISRSEVIARGHYWVSINVPYSQSAYHAGAGETKTYRTDCSGFISMAWHLTDSRWTGSLDDVSTVISYANLLPGDILMRDKDQTSGHVVLFEGWTDSSKTAMWILEEASTADDMNYRTVTVSDRQNLGYIAYRYDKIFTDSAGVTGDLGTTGAQCNSTAATTIQIAGRKDVVVEEQTCLKNESGTLTGYIVVNWSPSTGSDDSSDTTTSRFDGFKAHPQFQLSDINQKEASCDLTAALNASISGSKSCAVTLTGPGAGAWTTDGYVEWNEDNDGLYWLGPTYVYGSPVLNL